MKRNNAIFTFLIIISAGTFSLMIADHVIKDLRADYAARLQSDADLPDDPVRSAALKKKFEDMGLPLHEGQYWEKYDPAAKAGHAAPQERTTHVPR